MPKSSIITFATIIVLVAGGAQAQYTEKWSTATLDVGDVKFIDVGDTDGDNLPEILVAFTPYPASKKVLFLLDGSTGVWEWSYSAPGQYQINFASSSNPDWNTYTQLLDVDGDSQDEILVSLTAENHVQDIIKCFDLTVLNSVFDDPSSGDVPRQFKMGQNYPNPFNPNTVIPYAVMKPGQVTLTIHNALGQTIRVLVEEFKDAGEYSTTWDGKDGDNTPLASGVYFVTLNEPTGGETKKMVLLK